MKFRFIIYLLILLTGIAIFLYKTPEKPKWSPWYCSQHSGFHSNAWGPPIEECERIGCKIQKIKDFDDPQNFDDDGYTFKCIKK